ncbi:uncharacterized protein LY89DRAFT_424384 [Mollisia scopiformis]|uniref:PXA domain-containing protein n=1 Tax=Mollisia scopiformis TaxID=149040 RepID=A0A194XLP5_MOLSC|nr:uncharacterized protein LY89DRAFT_424384 [Mollisia scopiformis]KUJ21056.1 hypothetical protein LY89DRAFT_424384 [Mollisia scopiformis]
MSRLQPRSKSLATSNVSSQSASAISREPQSRPATPITRRSTRPPNSDPLSERATLFLIRRTLCSQLGEKGRSTPTPIDALLPPLTSSNEVDLQLYAYISIIIRDFVQTWYGKITPDQTFVEEVLRIIAHCTRALEQRLRKVDLESLLFDEVPELLKAHVEAYRISHSKLHPPPFEQDPRQIYHSLWPFPPLSTIPGNEDQATKLQQENESAYRQLLVQGVLAVLLPTEDLENECLTALVGQVFSDMIIGGSIGGKVSEPWMLLDGITKIAEAIKAQLPKSKAQVRVERSNSNLMGMSPTHLNSLNGGNTRVWRIKRSLQKTFWLILQYGFLAFTAVRFFIVTFATASSLPSRIGNTTKTINAALSKDGVEAGGDMSNTETGLNSSQHTTSKQPIMKMKIWSCASSLLDLDVRMPWLSATISLLQWVAITGPGEIGNTDGMVDK